MKQQYLLELRVTKTEGLKARTLGGYTFTGTLLLEADTQVFLKNNGIIFVSGIIDKRNNESINPIEFNEQIPISTNKFTYKKENKEETVEVDANIGCPLNSSIIDHIKVKIEKKGVVALFMFKSILLEGNAVKV